MHIHVPQNIKSHPAVGTYSSFRRTRVCFHQWTLHRKAVQFWARCKISFGCNWVHIHKMLTLREDGEMTKVPVSRKRRKVTPHRYHRDTLGTASGKPVPPEQRREPGWAHAHSCSVTQRCPLHTWRHRSVAVTTAWLWLLTPSEAESGPWIGDSWGWPL